MKIFVLAPRENWIIDRISQEFNNARPDILTQDIHNCDIVWLAAGWCWNQIPPQILSHKKVVVTIHHEVPEKFNEDRKANFLRRDRFVDHYHVPAHRTKKFIEKFTDKPVSVIGYWYDKNIWTPLDKIECRNVLGLTHSDYIVGSFQRDTEGSDLASPKLEKGPDLFCDYIEKINAEVKNIHVLLGAWRRQYVINRLKTASIKYTYVELAPIETLRKMYASCDLYVVASRHEGGPQSILECSAMKIPIISTDVGMASAVLSENCIIDVTNTTYFPAQEDVEFNYKNVSNFELQKHVDRYVDLFRSILQR